ncbi:hypothetical protein AFIC_001804 [[Pseudomonas] carboxydohydrogena]|uniref:Uncharacterized protein n=1 Tax=Afipia carboxydohydrogena TaxID=290 RepID=A0ABY8BJY5_AFICR|nr:hypothetical protein [[Pseudomonas] carboxydohydrogena]WEF50272.1 hypothetical protein AFIC_001804 [[Pseudomonas] carboxydohydrogena]
MRTSMKTIGSFSALAMTVALVTAPGAFAQSGRNAAGGSAPANSTLGAGSVMQAPVGHLQPRRDPSAGDQPYQATAEEKALDRKIKSICRGC